MYLIAPLTDKTQASTTSVQLRCSSRLHRCVSLWRAGYYVS